MTRVPREEGWFKPVHAIAGLLLVAVVGLYLAGYFFLWYIKADPLTASPLTTVRYWYYYGEREDVRKALLTCLVVGVGLAGACGVFAMWPKKRPLHGDARFATKKEVKEEGLLGEDGIILGRFAGQYMMLPGQQGVLLEAPPRSGKGVGFVIPNLLNWPGSTIVNDIKGENWTRTAGFRAAHGHQVHLFDPLAEDERTSRWNPFAYVSESAPYKTIDDLQRIAGMLYPDPPGTDPFWSTSARGLFLGIALYLFQTPGSTRTIGEVLRQGMASDAEGFQKHWRRLIDACEAAGYSLSQETIQILYDVIDLAPVTASSIRKSFTSKLDLWLNPLIDAATSGNDFDFRELRKRPISIYCRIKVDDMSRLQPVLNLFFQQAIGLQTKELPEDNPELRYQLLLMMDEFKSLGRLPVIADSTAFLPGFNVRTAIIVQSESQMVEVYGEQGAKSLRKMLAARIVFPPKDFDDAQAISKELGTYTVKQKSKSNRMFDGKGATISTSDQPRPLLNPREIQDLGKKRLILFYENLRPVLGGRLYYYKDRFFVRREVKAPVVPKLDLTQVKPLPAVPRSTPDDDQPYDGSTESNAIEAAPPRPRRAKKTEANQQRAQGGGNAQQAEARAIGAADVAQLDQMSLENFSLDFDHIVIPKGQPLTDGEIQNAVDSFLATLAD